MSGMIPLTPKGSLCSRPCIGTPPRRFHAISAAVLVSPTSGCVTDRSSFHFNHLSKRTQAYFPHNRYTVCNLRKVSFSCNAVSRKNPDFSRQNKGFPRGRSRKHQDKDSSENAEESDPLTSKNGSILSLSSNPRYQATAIPGQREKEIVELFRKVQKQLRERAAIKEEKRIEASQQGQGERGTVDSLLKLLKKHSMDQKNRTRMDEDNTNLDRAEQIEDDQKAKFFGTSSVKSKEIHEPNPVEISRPVSNFKRKSPVPRVKFQPIYSAEESISKVSGSSTMLEEEDKSDELNVDSKIISLDGTDEILPDDLSDASDSEETYEEIETSSETENTDLSSLKVTELRDLAKSRGIKGYSKMKKGELVELLGGTIS